MLCNLCFSSFFQLWLQMTVQKIHYKQQLVLY
uniref:Uncharacterized protein n=1 Tax=Anguilla anguilla TaxID=7936 RepID=A0A0E9VR06_ANGAN